MRRLLPTLLLAATALPGYAADSVLLREFVAEPPATPQSHAATLVETGDGDLLAAWFGGTHEGAPDIRIWLARRNAKGWSAPVAVADGGKIGGKPQPAWNPVLFRPENGPLMLFYKAGPEPRRWHGNLIESGDGGRTWSAPRRLPDNVLGPIRSKPVQLADGTLVSPSSTEDGGWKVHFERSEDGGRTWKRTSPVADPAGVEAIQPSLAMRADGSLLALGRSKRDRVFTTESRDGGRHWSPLRLLDLPNPNAAVDLLHLTDGRYLLVYNPRTAGKEWWDGRDRLSVALSDDGERWTEVLTLEDEPGAEFSYPSAIQTRDGKVHVVYTWKRERIRHVVLDPTQLGTTADDRPAYLDPTLDAERRAVDLVGRLTLEEKAAQMRDDAPAVPRLGIPAYNWWNEGVHGLARNGHATVFPQAIGQAATWNPELLRQVGDTVAAEARAKFAAIDPANGYPRYAGLSIWSPNINILRDPRWGRGQETYGEDPFLTARLAVAFVHGLQGDDPQRPKTIATPKHYAVHSGPEPGRHGFNASPTPHDLEDTYLPAFRAAVVEGGAGSVMCAYNAVDGIPACANPDLLQRRLREDWGFSGYVVSDCGAINDMTQFHRYTVDNAEASARSVAAGTDLNCGSGYRSLAGAVRRGLLPEATLDRSLQRLLAARIRLGMYEGTGQAVSPDGAVARELALTAARESLVLLKNDGALPLRDGATVAVVGPTADLLENLEANYHGTARDPLTPLAGIRRQFGAERVLYAQGSALAGNVPVAIPSDALRSRDGAPGLTGEYFDNPDLSGTPVVVRTDAKVNFNFNRVPPAPGLSPDRYGVRWSGWLLPPAPGRYAFNVRVARCFDCSGHDRVRLYVDGRLLHDSLEDPANLTLEFDDTRPRELRLELRHTGQDEGITLEWIAPPAAQREQAVAAARQADAVVAFVGLSPNLEGEQLKMEVPGFNGGDRTSLDLPAAQQELLQAVGATGKPLVVVLSSGSAVALNWADRHADAVLAAWYPGEAGGQAVAEALAGAFSPAGRLPMTFHRSADDLPPMPDYRMQGRTYRYFRGQALYPFGHGLSYTRFGYGEPRLSRRTLEAGEPLKVSVEVRNEGARDSDEVVQAYLTPPPSPEAPRHALVGFRRVHLRAGERRTVELELTPRALSTVDAEGRRAVRAGRYVLSLGGGQPGHAEVRSVQFTIRGEHALPR